MNNKLDVGNVASTTSQNDLRALFMLHGNVAEIQFPAERQSGSACAFAIVTMATPQGARAAMLALNGREVDARALTVIEHVASKRGSATPGRPDKVPGRW